MTVHTSAAAGTVRQALLIAVGPRAAKAAHADQRASARDVVRVGRWHDVLDVVTGSGHPASALVVLPGAELTYAAVESLLDVSVTAGVPLGVLPIGRDGRLPGAGRRKAPPAPHTSAMYCQFRPTFDCDAEYGREETEEFLARLTGGVEAAVFHAHGNGADLQVGGHVMCVQADDLHGTPRPGDLTLPCHVGGPCRLSHLPVKGYWGPAAMRARIVVLVSCWGYLPADGVIHPELLFGTALFRGPTTEAFIASTRVTFNTPEVTQAALAFLELGGTAGELTMLLNRFPGTATPPYVCIGDPDVRVQAPGGHARHACTGRTSGHPAATVPGDGEVSYAQLAALEAASRHADLPAEARSEIMAAFGPLLKEGRRVRVSEQTRALVARSAAATPGSADGGPALTQTSRYRAFTALMARHMGNLPADEADAFWDLVHRDPPEPDLDARWSQVQAKLLRGRGPEQHGYLSASAIYRHERLDTAQGRARHTCGNRMFRITIEFVAVDGYLRELCFCERCGPVCDVPVGTPAPFLVAGTDGARVLGSPWPSAWVVAAVVPVGPALFTPSVPSVMALSGLIPLPPDAGPGRRLGVALVRGGDHVLLETELAPFPVGPGAPVPGDGQDRPGSWNS